MDPFKLIMFLSFGRGFYKINLNRLLFSQPIKELLSKSSDFCFYNHTNIQHKHGPNTKMPTPLWLQLTADNLYCADPAPVPLAGHLHPGQLGAGQHPGKLGVLGAEILVQVATDAGRDLERAQECEEDAEQDVQAPDDEGCHDERLGHDNVTLIF